MNIYSFPAIVAFVINFTMTFIVFFGNPKSSVNRWISAFVLGFAVWNISEIFILASGSQEGAALAAQVLYRVIFIMPAFYVVSAYHFPRSVSRLTGSALFNVVVFLLPVIFLISSFPNFHIKLISLSGSSTVYFYRIMVRPDFQSVSLLTTFFVYLLWGSFVVVRKLPVLRTTTQKHHARLFLLGGLVFLIFSLMMFIVERFARQTLYFYATSTILSSVVSAFFATAVLQGHFFKSPGAARSGVAYSIASSIVLAIYFLSVQAVTEGLLNYLKISSYAANALFVLLLVFLIRPLELRIHRTLDNLLSRDLNRYRHSMVGFSHEISNYFPTSELFGRVGSFLSRQFHIQNVLVFLKDEKSEHFFELSREAGSREIEKSNYLVKRLSETRVPIEFYDLDRNRIDERVYSYLDSQGVRLLFPLLSADELIGILGISVRKSGQEFTTDMIEALSIFANEVATSYQRNLTIDKMRDREQEQFRNRHLASLGQLTAGVAHEIRNPLNVMSTSAQTLLKKKLNEEDEKELKQFIVDEADRLNKILTDFLSLSKLRPPKYETVSLGELLQRVQTGVMAAAGEIEVQVKIGEPDTKVLTDRDMLHQLLFNLGSNAVEAIKERCKSDEGFSCAKGLVTLSTGIQGERLMISISDNGAGIPEDSLGKVFDPFYTTKETGTGLGLSISHNIAETLGGHISVKSGKGATVFSFTCDMKKEYA